MSKQRLRPVNAIEVKCPTCGANPGKPCVSLSVVFPGDVDYFHGPRRQAADDTRVKASIGDILRHKGGV